MRDRSQDRLYDLLPGHHRARDAAEGRPLQALMRLLTEELNVVEDDLDQLYDNWFIETCEPWAIPYVGALVGARQLRPFGETGGALRAHVALEQLARDVTGWPAVAVEFFQRLIVSQNLNHVRPAAFATASLHDAEAARLTGGAFGQACRTGAAGPAAGRSGRYNIPNLGLFLWRLQSVATGFTSSAAAGRLGGPEPRADAAKPWQRRFDPLGRDRPLVNRPRADADLAARTSARNAPGPLDRRTLHRDLEDLRAGRPGAGDWFKDPPCVQIRLGDQTLPPERLHCCALEDRDDGLGGIDWRRPDAAGHVLFDPELGRLSLHPDDEGAAVETSHAWSRAFDIGAGPQDGRASVDAWRPRLFPEGEAPPWRIGVSARAEDATDDPEGPVVATLAEAIARWNAAAVPGARGVIAMMDSASHAQDLSDPAHVVAIPARAALAVVAAGWPLRDPGGGAARAPDGLSPAGRRPHVRSDLLVRGDAALGETAGTLILDGLLLEGEVRVEDGDLGLLELRRCTIGADAAGLQRGVRVVAGAPPLSLLADHSEVGRIDMGAATGEVTLCDAILGEDVSVDHDPAAAPLLLDAEGCDLRIARATVFGAVRGRTLFAENAILQGRLSIARRQTGCLRFCHAPLDGRMPRRHRCAPDTALTALADRLGRPLSGPERAAVLARVAPAFTATRHGDEGFGQLALTCAPEIGAGAEGGAAMGAGFRHGDPFRLLNLRDALEEYLPFGLEAGVIFVT